MEARVATTRQIIEWVSNMKTWGAVLNFSELKNENEKNIVLFMCHLTGGLRCYLSFRDGPQDTSRRDIGKSDKT